MINDPPALEDRYNLVGSRIYLKIVLKNRVLRPYDQKKSQELGIRSGGKSKLQFLNNLGKSLMNIAGEFKEGTSREKARKS